MNHPYKVATTGTRNLGQVRCSTRCPSQSVKSHVGIISFCENFTEIQGLNIFNTFENHLRQHSSPKQERLYKRGLRTVFNRPLGIDIPIVWQSHSEKSPSLLVKSPCWSNPHQLAIEKSGPTPIGFSEVMGNCQSP